MDLELKNIAWVEKYRPQKINDVVITSKEKIKKYLENQESIPNFLFSSRTPGTGKTTTAKAIINELGCDYLILNSSDDRKIEVVREKIKNFVMTQSSNGKKKCVFLDEADGMLKATQEALRNMMETYSSNAFFILTCNYIDKIIEPIRNRCIEINFTKPEKNEIKDRLIKILGLENMEYDQNGLDKLVNIYYPSIRNMVNYLQDLKIQNKKLVIENILQSNSEFDKIWRMIKELKFTESRIYILENNIDCFLLNRYLFNKITNDGLVINKLAKLIRIIADNEYKMKLGADAQIIFISSIIDMILALK